MHDYELNLEDTLGKPLKARVMDVLFFACCVIVGMALPNVLAFVPQPVIRALLHVSRSRICLKLWWGKRCKARMDCRQVLFMLCIPYIKAVFGQS